MTLALDFGSGPDTASGDTALQAFAKIETELNAQATAIAGLQAASPINVTGLAAITLSASTLAENATQGTAIGNLVGLTTGSSRRLLNDSAGQVQLNTAGTALQKGPGASDYESGTTIYPTFQEHVDDGAGGTIDKISTLAVTITNVADNIYTAPDYFIRPAAHGTGDGSSYANAMAFTAANVLTLWAAAAAKVSGTRIIGVFADEGEYTWTTAGGITPVGSGTSGNRIILTGMGANYQPMRPVVRGIRQAFVSPYVAETTTVFPSDSGNPLFRMGGINHWQISWLAPIAIGNAAVVNFIGACDDVVVDNLLCENVQRVIDNSLSGATITNFTISNISATGFSKQAIRIRSDASAGTIGPCVLNSLWQEEFPGFTVGVGFDGTAHNITVTDVEAFNMRETLSGNSYKNGDGASTERGNYNITFVRPHMYSNTDSGMDLKGSGHVITDPTFFDCKRNCRFWDQVTITGLISNEPHSRDGNTAAHVWGAGESNRQGPAVPGFGADIMITGGTLTSVSPATETFYGADTGGRTVFRVNGLTENVAGSDHMSATAGQVSYVFRSGSAPVGAPSITSANPPNYSTPEAKGYAVPMTFNRTVTYGPITGADASIFSAVELVGPFRMAAQTYAVDNVRDCTVSVYDGARNSLAVSPQITITDVTDFRTLDINPSAVADGSGAFVDTSPLANSLTIGSAVKASNTLAGLGIGNLIKFIGTGGSPNNVIQITDSENARLEGDFEIYDLPIYLSNVTTAQALIGHWTTTGNQRGWLLSVTAAGKIQFEISSNGDSSPDLTLTHATTLSINTLYYVRVRRSGSTITLTLYNASNVVVGSAVSGVFAGTSFDSSANLVIGAYGSYNAYIINPGYLGRPRIYKGATFT